MQGRMKRSCVRAYTLLLIGGGRGDSREDEERSGIYVPWSGLPISDCTILAA